MSSLPRAIVTDIEGTTTPIPFVTETLFPYARARLADFVAAHRDEPAIRELLSETRTLGGTPQADEAACVRLLLSWMDEDRKAPPLKALQGMIWAEGYAQGELRGAVYEDAARSLRAWKAAGILLFCYSSGSVEAQRLIFGHSDQGELASLFDGFFDTRLGPKKEADSYRALAQRIGVPAGLILFLSDSEAELDAARTAGLRTAQLARAGAAGGGHPVHATFETLP